MAQQTLPFEKLDAGDAQEYVDQRIFGNSVDDLENHIRRKKAIANEARYSILYLLYEYGEMSRKRLSDETGRTSNKLQQPLRKLLDAHLIEKIPGPRGADERKTYYRPTTLGRQEIASDLRNIIGGNAAENHYELLIDADLSADRGSDGNRFRRQDTWEIETPEDFKSMRSCLREHSEQHQATGVSD